MKKLDLLREDIRKLGEDEKQEPHVRDLAQAVVFILEELYRMKYAGGGGGPRLSERQASDQP